MSDQNMEVEGKEEWQQYYVMTMTGVKVLSLIAAFTYAIAKKKGWSSQEDFEKIKSTLKSIFNILLGGLLIIYFHPMTENIVCIQGNVKMFIFTTSILLLIDSFKNIFNL